MISDEVRMNYLADILKNHKKEAASILQYMNAENKEKLIDILGEKKIKEMKKPKEIESKKRVITVCNNPKFISELCISLAKTYKKSNIAILDANRFSANLDIFLNSKSHNKSIYTQLELRRSTGMNLLIDGMKKNMICKSYIKKIAIHIRGYKNIDFFSGSYVLDDYEYYHLKDYQNILAILKESYDILLIHVNDFLYDAFTVYSLMFSDCNLIPFSATIADIKKYKEYFDFLEKKQDIHSKKNFYILFNYKNVDMDEGIVKHYLHQQYIGYIPYDKKREESFVFNYKLTKHMKKSLQKKYISLIAKCEV